VLFGYYLALPAVVAIIWCARNERPMVLRAFTAAGLAAFHIPHTYPQPVFFAILVAGLGYVCGPMVQAIAAADSSSAPRAPNADSSSGVSTSRQRPFVAS